MSQFAKKVIVNHNSDKVTLLQIGILEEKHIGFGMLLVITDSNLYNVQRRLSGLKMILTWARVLQRYLIPNL